MCAHDLPFGPSVRSYCCVCIDRLRQHAALHISIHSGTDCYAGQRIRPGAAGRALDRERCGCRRKHLVGKPYRYGGGHRNFYDTAYDCSGSVSYVLHSIGRMYTPTPSNELRHYGESGAGKWITVYASQGHSFIVVAGLRFDTGYGSGQHGPKWLTRSRPANEFVLRHPGGL